MPSTPDYIAVNKQSWNSRTPLHLASAFYDVAGFLAGKTSLQPIELALLGDVAGKRILHLQCHFGQDTISLARMGAHVMGVDLSDEAIRAAERLANQTGVTATFICCDVYDLPAHLDAIFDIVFTSYGVIGWLPDMDRWARLIATYLAPGGRLVFAEFHPVVWMFDNDFQGVAYRYFKSDPIVETETGTYADPTAPVELTMVTWNHSLSEVLGALLRSGLTLEAFEEFDYSPYNCFRNTREDEPGRYRIAHLEDRIPMVYALMARKGRVERIPNGVIAQVVENLQWLSEQDGKRVSITDMLTTNSGNYNRHFTRTSAFEFEMKHFGIRTSGAIGRIEGQNSAFEFKTDQIRRIERQNNELEIESILDINTSRLIRIKIGETDSTSE